MIILGIALLLGTIAAFIGAISKTPDNLRGFYGTFYILLALGGLVGGVMLIVSTFFS